MGCMTHTTKEGAEKIIYNNNNNNNNNNNLKYFFCVFPHCVSCTPRQLSARLKNLKTNHFQTWQFS